MVFWQKQHGFTAGRKCLAVHDREGPCLPAATWPCGHIHAPRLHGRTRSPCQLPPVTGPQLRHCSPIWRWGEGKQREQVPLRGAGQQEEGSAASGAVHTTPRRLGSERSPADAGRAEGRCSNPGPPDAPFLCPLKPHSLGTRTHDGHRTTCTTDPSRTEGP